MIRERIKKRAELIAKMEELQKIDLIAIGEYQHETLGKEMILKGVLKCTRRDFDSVFWRHKASGKVNQISKNVQIRQMYFYLCKTLTKMSLSEIGTIPKDNTVYQVYDHSSVIHGVMSHTNLIDTYKSEKKFSDSVLQYIRMQ